MYSGTIPPYSNSTKQTLDTKTHIDSTLIDLNRNGVLYPVFEDLWWSHETIKTYKWVYKE